MLTRYRKALSHFLIAGKPDGDAATMIAIVGFGYNGKADAPRGADRLLGVIDHFLLGYRQAEGCQYLVRLLFVACQLNGDVRGAAGDRGLNALLVFAVPELY